MEQSNRTKAPKRGGKIFKLAIKTVSMNFYRHNLSKNAASLAYYLLFSLFPFLIFLSNLLGLLDLNVYTITHFLSNFLPSDVVALVENYLDYVATNSSHTLLWFSLVFSVWFPFRAVQGLMDDVRRAYSLKRPRNFLYYTLKQLVYTMMFLAILVLTLLLTLMGENVLSSILSLFPSNLHLSDYVLQIWQYLRFLPAGLLMFCAIGFLYSIALDEPRPFRSTILGALIALISWLVVSIGFSFYVENFSHYSAIYGTLGTVIVLILWLYLTAFLLILGAELNAAIEKARNAVAAEFEREADPPSANETK
ncbi:MAG: YihY/virulence factor BrkB family protein [Clostridia bacterium]|nr:YihY/virulence factor BrkB family protein [Clostridia bacterium]